MNLLEDLNLSAPLKKALAENELVYATPIQQKVFAPVMAGKDVCGIAQTGTGKTIAYLLPLLRLWQFSAEKTASILILVPTRELVVQVEESIIKIAAYINVTAVGVYGGVNIKTQQEALANKTDIVIGTPGRVYDLALSGSLRFNKIKHLVIDEMDELLNLGFRRQLENILNLLPVKRQTLFFSATLEDEVEGFINENFSFYEKIEAAASGTPLKNIKQVAYEVPNFNTKINLLKFLLVQEAEFVKVLLFVSTKKLADNLFEQLQPEFENRLNVIHSNKDQNYRFNAVKNFEEIPNQILIATDIIARGIDVSDITQVINFDVPDTTERYMHRIGRTGRANKTGAALTLYTPKEKPRVEAIEEWMSYKIPLMALPEEVEISEVLIDDELDIFIVPEIKLKPIKREAGGGAFHEKSAKNSRENFTMSRKEKMMKKYGKPKTRGQKTKRKK